MILEERTLNLLRNPDTFDTGILEITETLESAQVTQQTLEKRIVDLKSANYDLLTKVTHKEPTPTKEPTTEDISIDDVIIELSNK